MAVSPLVTHSHEHHAGSTSKDIQTSKGMSNGSDIDRREADASERMNDEERKKYVKDKKVGEGTYAIVYLGHLRSDPKSLVAIKKIKVQKEYEDGMAMDAVRELKHLQELQHPNIIALKSVFSSKDQNINLVLEFLPLGDLEQLIRDVEGVRYGAADIKAWMCMLGRAIWFCHENFVLHRDIKPNNLLIAADGEVKLADFGLARSFSDPYKLMTYNVITRWYRPPELLFGARHYSGAVDIWSVGLVFAELILRTPYIAGDTEMHQLNLISQAIGSPTEDNWPGVTELPSYIASEPNNPVRGRDHYLVTFATAGQDGVDLIMATLVLDPSKRITAKEFLQHPYWLSEPRPTKKGDLPKKGGGIAKMGDDLKRRPAELDEFRTGKVARKLAF